MPCPVNCSDKPGVGARAGTAEATPGAADPDHRLRAVLGPVNYPLELAPVGEEFDALTGVAVRPRNVADPKNFDQVGYRLGSLSGGHAYPLLAQEFREGGVEAFGIVLEDHVGGVIYVHQLAVGQGFHHALCYVEGQRVGLGSLAR